MTENCSSGRYGDFDLCWRNWSTDGDGAKTGLNNVRMPWIDQLRAKDPLFCDILKERWQIICSALSELTQSGGIIDQYAEELRGSWNRDYAVWYSDDDGGAQEEDIFGEETEILKEWITLRQEWINEHIEEEINKVFFSVTYKDDGKVIKTIPVRNGSILDSGPEMPEKDGYVFRCWVNEKDDSMHRGTTVSEDMTFVPKYMKAEELPVPEQICFVRQEAWASLKDEIYYPGSVTVISEESQEPALEYARWTVSDENIGTVDPDGFIDLATVGDLTVTLTLYNGVSSAYLLHVYNPADTPAVLPETVTILPEKMDLSAGQQEQITYSVETNGSPCGEPYEQYESSDPAVATVDSTGLVTALKPGTATITLTIEFYMFDTEPMTAACEITVSDP